MSFTRKTPTAAKKQSKSIRQDLAAMLVEREAELAEVRRQRAATAEILNVIAASPTDAQPAFEAIAARANTLIGGFSTAVFRIFGNAVHLAAFTSTNPGADEALRAMFPLPVAQFPGLELVSHGDCAQVADTELDTAVRDLARLRGYRSMLFTPLLSNGALIGIISVTRRAPGAFAAHQVQLLQTFADQAVIAINNVANFNETQAALRQQTATADVLKVISRSAFDLQAVLDTLVSSAAALCGASNGLIYLQSGDTFEVKAATKDWNPETFRLLSETRARTRTPDSRGSRPLDWRRAESRRHAGGPRLRPRHPLAEREPRAARSPVEAGRCDHRRLRARAARSRSIQSASSPDRSDLRRPSGDCDRERAPVRRGASAHART